MKAHFKLLIAISICFTQGVHSILGVSRPISLKHLDDIHEDNVDPDHRIFQLNVPYGASTDFAAGEFARLETMGLADTKVKAKELLLRKHFRRSLRKAKVNYIQRLSQIRDAKLRLKEKRRVAKKTREHIIRNSKEACLLHKLNAKDANDGLIHLLDDMGDTNGRLDLAAAYSKSDYKDSLVRKQLMFLKKKRGTKIANIKSIGAINAIRSHKLAKSLNAIQRQLHILAIRETEYAKQEFKNELVFAKRYRLHQLNLAKSLKHTRISKARRRFKIKSAQIIAKKESLIGKINLLYRKKLARATQTYLDIRHEAINKKKIILRKIRKLKEILAIKGKRIEDEIERSDIRIHESSADESEKLIKSKLELQLKKVYDDIHGLEEKEKSKTLSLRKIVDDARASLKATKQDLSTKRTEQVADVNNRIEKSLKTFKLRLATRVNASRSKYQKVAKVIDKSFQTSVQEARIKSLDSIEKIKSQIAELD